MNAKAHLEQQLDQLELKTANLASVFHVLSALDARPREPVPPPAGLTQDGRGFVRLGEDGDLRWLWSFTVEGPMPHERSATVCINDCTVIGRGETADLPLSMFSSKYLDMIAEEIEAALNEQWEAYADDPGDRGDYEYQVQQERRA